MNSAPVVLFVYNRPSHTRRTIDALKLNDGWNETDVIVYCDGPKESERSLLKINETRKVVESISGCKSLVVHKSEKNKGLKKSIVEGVTAVLNNFEKIIVVEDDILTDLEFLNFTNSALEKYRSSSEVACISGYVYPLKENFTEAFFIRGADCWGWATWKERWDEIMGMDIDEIDKLKSDKNLQKDFTFNYSYPYMEMLNDQAQGKNQSWAIYWYAKAFLKNKLCLYPPYSLVTNIGNDGSGTHSSAEDTSFNSGQSSSCKINLPGRVEENASARKQFEIFFRSRNKNLTDKIILASKIHIKNALNKITGKSNSQWSGNYKSWESAKEKSSGYDSVTVLNKVKDAVLKVKSGEAVYERDSVLFNEIHVDENILNALNSISKENANKLHIVDFGGSLGSSYFQNKNFISDLKELKWSIVEQKHFVEAGKESIADENLKFHFNIDEALSGQQKQVLLLASVLQYIEKPFELISKLINYKFDYIIIDRTAFIERSKDILTVQNVPEEIYKASYPAWFFNEKNFVEPFLKDYLLVDEFMSEVSLPFKLNGNNVYWKGFVLKNKNA